MKRNIVTGAMLTCALLANAEVRTAEQALDIAKQFVKDNAAMQSKTVVALSECKEIAAKVRRQNARTGAANMDNPYYIFNIGDGGYVIVSGDDRFESILGYSDHDNINTSEELPDGLQYWLGFYEKEMANATAELPISNNDRMNAKAEGTNYFQTVEPLVKTQWDQNLPYNNMVPGKSPTGCVATGTAQVMKYWAYPTNGVGSHTNRNGGAFINFETATYDWDNMLNRYDSGFETVAEVNSVATLMYHVGVATDMQWGAQQSATENINAAAALINNFGYNKYIYSEQRDCMSLGAWKALVIEQLQSGHPLCYAGADIQNGKYMGHFFVCDGYDANTGKFHFNWGWSGRYDGYYALTALKPGTGGTGAGSGSYNSDQHILVNVQPTETGSYRAPFDAVTVAPTATTCNKQSMTIRTNQLANNTVNFDGVFGAALYDANGTLVKFVPSSTAFPAGLRPGSAFNGDSDMLFNLSEVGDGTYTMCIAAQHKDMKDILTPLRAHYGNPYTYTLVVSGNTLTITPKIANISIEPSVAPVLVSNNDGLVYQNVMSHYTITVTNNGITDFFDEVGVRLGKVRGGSYVDFLTPCYIPAGQTKTVDIYGITPNTFNIDSQQNLYTIIGANGNIQSIGNPSTVTVKSEADDIPFVNAGEEMNNTIYSINGQVMSNNANLPKGIYIQNNKKFIVK